MSEFQTVSESELQSVEGGFGALSALVVALWVAADAVEKTVKTVVAAA